MKKEISWKKIVFAILALIVCVRIVYIANGDLDKAYYYSDPVNLTDAWSIPCVNVSQKFTPSETRVYAIETILSGIEKKTAGTLEIIISSDDRMVYKATVALEKFEDGIWEQIFINYPLSAGEEYIITLNALNCKQVPNIYVSDYEWASPEVIYDENSETLGGEIAVRYGYLKEPSIVEKVLSSLIWGLFLCIVALGIKYSEFIRDKYHALWNHILSKGNEDAIRIVLQVLLFMIMSIGEVAFGNTTKIVFYIISIFTAWGIRQRNEEVARIFDRPWKKVCLYGLYLYGAFALLGENTLIYPFDVGVTVRGWISLLAAVWWFGPVINSLIYILVCTGKRIASDEGNKLSAIVFIGICSACLIVPAAINLYANNPGNSSPDSWSCLVENARHLRGMSNWHPAFYCIILRIIITIWDSTYAVILVQYMFWLYVVMEALLFFRKKKIKDIWLVIIALFLGTSAANVLHLNTIWKDVPYAIALLWLVIILGKLVTAYEDYDKKWYIYLELVAALVCTYFFRKNGIVPFVCVIFAALAVFRKSKRVWCSIAVTIAMVFLIQGPIYDYLEVEDTGRWGMYIGLGQDILGAYYADGEISESTSEMINVMTNYDPAEYYYIPTWASQSYALDVEPMEFIVNYLDTFIKNPVTMIKAILTRIETVWCVFAELGTNLVDFHDTMDGIDTWNQFYPARQWNSFYEPMAKLTQWTAYEQCVAAVQWNCGVFTLMGIVALVIMLVVGCKKQLIFFSPVVGQILSLLLSTGWADFRYFWPLNLMNLFVVLFALLAFTKRKNTLEQSEEDGQ